MENPVSAFHSVEGPPPTAENAAGGQEHVANFRTGRKVEFDAFHKAQVCGLIGAGMSQRQAAIYSGFSPSLISKTLRRDKKFASDVARAVVSAQLHPLYKIIKASERSWRAAAWLYEHAQPHTDLAERDARRAARKAEKLAPKQAVGTDGVGTT